MDYTRRSFIHNVFLASLCYSPLINELAKVRGSDLPKRAFNDTSIVDLHCHPNLKNYLWGHHMWSHHLSCKGANKINMQVDVHKLSKGNVKGFLAAHYLPELGFKEQAATIKKWFPKLKFIAPAFAAKLEMGSEANFRQLNTMLDDFEDHVEKTNYRNDKVQLRIARTYEEFEQIIQSGSRTIAIAHSIEGAHSLGRGMSSAEQYMDHLNLLFRRGICLITIAHFFANDLCYNVEGIPPHNKDGIGLHWKYHPAFDNRQLTETGKAVVTEMLRLGIIADLTHLAPAARSQVFEINKKYNRPVIFSHTGVEALFDGPEEYQNFKYMEASDEEIKEIQACGGVIGIIFMNYWLVGNDTHTYKGEKKDFKRGIEYVIKTIKYIRDKTGGYDHISFGSDFDGLADAPADLKNPSFYPDLLERLRQELKISPADMRKITHENAMRVLRDGWKNYAA